MIYGFDFNPQRQQSYLDLYSIGRNGEAIHRWGLKKLKRDLITNDASWTVTLPVTHDQVVGSSSGSAPASHQYSLRFCTKKQYERFVHLCGLLK